MTSLSTLQWGLLPDVIVVFWGQRCNFVGVCDSNEAEVSAILEILRFFSRNFHGGLIVKSDSSNAIARVSNRKANPWKFQFYFNEIWTLSSIINVFFHHVLGLANSMADALAKQGSIGYFLEWDSLGSWGVGWGTMLLYLFSSLCSLLIFLLWMKVFIANQKKDSGTLLINCEFTIHSR